MYINRIIICSVFYVFLISARSVVAQDWKAYEYDLILGKEALFEQDYERAFKYFEQAHHEDPENEAPLYYINYVKRLKERRVSVIPSVPSPTVQPIVKKIYTKELPVIPIELPPTAIPFKKVQPTRTETIVQKPIYPAKPSTQIIPGKKYEGGTTKISAPLADLVEGQGTIYLNDELMATQPRTQLHIELSKSAILEGKNIERYLIISPGFIEVERVDQDHLKINALKRGATILHMWDEHKRWTFNVEVILPIATTTVFIKEKQSETFANPFRLAYSSDWNSFYIGPSLDKVERESLNFIQWIGMYGETPYGNFDGSVIYNKFEESTELTGYSGGITDGHVGQFQDLNLRGGDFSKIFSPLTLPGQYMRGQMFDTKAFHHNLGITYLQGRDRFTYGVLAPGVIEKRQSFIEGARVVLFPEQENKYAFNYTRGYGNGRQNFLQDRVVSVEAQHRVKKLLVNSEVAYDENHVSQLASVSERGKNYNWNLNFRNIDRDFTTVTNYPGNRGEVGSILNYNWNSEKLDLFSSLDIYQNRFLNNPDEPHGFNYDFNSNLDITLSPSEHLRPSFSYLDTPGELSPQKNLRMNLIYSKYLKLWDKDFNWFIGPVFQRSRFELSPSSEYDRFSLTAGFSYQIIQGLSYFANYEYSWLDELTDDTVTPHVINTGFNYSKQLTRHWSGNTTLAYRNEENTESVNSFLAGEDSLTGSVGASYRPTQDFEFFMDGRVRNIWREGLNSGSHNEVDIRSGVRTVWDLPFTWNPSGIVEGIVYKDFNGNKVQDAGEKGMAQVIVNVGKKKVMTDGEGHYQAKVSAKTVEVSVDMDSVPEGFIFSTPFERDVEISHHEVKQVNFGLTSQSGIFGVVYVDEDKDGKPSEKDIFIAKVKMLLDEKEIVFSDYEGTYIFKNVKPGKHTVRLVLESLPLEYLPRIKLKNDVEIAEGTTYVFHVPLTVRSLEKSKK